MRFRRSIAAISAVTLLLIPALASAAQAPAGQGLEIAPPVISLTANPGQVLHTQMRVRNVTSQTLLARAQYDDFVANGEEGQPKILLDKSEQSPYSIKDWIRTIPAVTLASQQQQTVDITLNVPKNAAPGGHYGVIRFTGAPPDVDETAVSLSASVGSLMLVTVSGNVQEQARIAEISTSQNGKKQSLFEYGPVTITTRVENTGNVHLQPKGTIHVTNMFGKQVGNFQLNQANGNVLPKSIRRFNVTLDKKLLFGRYKAVADVVYGKDSTIITSSTTFWVIPYKLILICLAVVFAIIFLIRRYNRLIVKRAQKGTGNGPKKRRRFSRKS
jgi:hypothetical protein